MTSTTEPDLPGYLLRESLGGNGKTAVYRALRLSDERPVVVKTLVTEGAGLKHLHRLRHEYDILRGLQGDQFVKVLELKSFNGKHALIMEDVGGISLYHEMRLRPYTLVTALELLEKTAEQLQLLHGQGVIHKDVNPSNIVHNADTGLVRLIDFSIAGRRTRETRKATPVRSLEGTLPYISPEQTGRMNRTIDYRTDFYSLGMTFYQLLTGTLPFTVTDPMELVHCHIAHQPRPVHERRPRIPPAVSAVISKLTEKNAEDRYQSAQGIRADVARCLSELRAGGTVSNFRIGERDLRNTFRIPQKLYGREPQLAVLRESIARVNSGPNEVLLISGRGGTGKTSLLQELHKTMAAYGGRLVGGKFDPYQRNTPFTPVIGACRDLIRHILGESDALLAGRRTRILNELGPSTGVIMEVVPELALVVGDVPLPPHLTIAEEENRFQLAMRRFLALFAEHGRPLVLVFDDLQWADAATLNLMAALVSDTDIHGMLLIGTYREASQDEHVPLDVFLESIGHESVPVTQVTLAALNESETTQLVAETLHRDPTSVAPLAALVHAKTQGNPFFTGEYLRTLEEEGLLFFNNGHGLWEWDLNRISRESMDDDAAAFMAGKIQKLPAQARRLLTRAACLGNPFSLNDLAALEGTSLGETTLALYPAVTEGLLVPLSESPGLEDGPEPGIHYEFHHDQVHQAAYAVLDDAERTRTHLAVGRMLLTARADDALDEVVFDIVNHLNLGLSELDDPSEMVTLVQLNTIAGRKARVSGAYDPAVNYLTKGLELLGSDPWQLYDLAMPLTMELAECHYLRGRLGQAEHLFDQAQAHALTELEKAAVFQTRTMLYAHQGKYVEAIEVGLEGLALFGIEVPYMDDVLRGTIAQVLTGIREKMNGRAPDDLMAMPQLTDPLIYAAINQLINLWSPASNVNLNLMKLLVLKIVDLSLTHGNVDVSSYGYVGYALVLGSGFGDYRTGEAFGELGLKINDRFQNQELKCRVYFVHGALVKPWRNHIRESAPLMSEAYEAGLESGDIMWASLCLVHMVVHRMLAGDPLKSIEAEARGCLSFLKKARYEQSVEILETILRFIALMRNPEAADEPFAETAFLTRNQRKLYLVAVNHYYTLKAQHAYLLGAYDTAEAASLKAKQLDLYKFGWPALAEQVLIMGLSHAALWHTAEGDAADRHLDHLHECLEHLQKWSYECPENFRCRYLLLAAESARVTNNFEKALDYFDEAIESARTGEFTHIEAMANERAARFLLSKGKARLARTYLQEAYVHYNHWDAEAKCAQLRQEFPELTASMHPEPIPQLAPVDGATTTQDNAGALDMASIMKASLAISSEIHLDRLLGKLMMILIENAGAHKGYLLLENEGRLYLEASGTVDGSEVSVLQSVPLDDCTMLSRAIVNYVHHSREEVVLGNAAKEAHLTSDPFLVGSKARSLLCQPVMYKGKLAGVVYLENNLVAGAFTPYRQEVLQMLTGEAAISIENARLYRDLTNAGRRLQQTNAQLEHANFTLEQKVEERTSELKEKNEKLAETLARVKDMQQQIIQQEKMASLGTLSAGIAHEIRNPLNFVNNFAAISVELLDEIKEELSVAQTAGRAAQVGNLLTDLTKNLGKIHDHGKRADDIVHSMLMHSHRNSKTRPEPTDVNAMLEKFLNLAYHSMRAKNPINLAIDKQFDPGLLEIEAIPQDLGRVFLNLVDNAFDAMRTRLSQEPSYQPELLARTRDADTHVEISIGDNGHGIPEEALAHIFNPFFTTKPAGQGTGLGLSISYDIVVKEHQGQISACSEEGKRTVFTIRLPKQRYKPIPN